MAILKAILWWFTPGIGFLYFLGFLAVGALFLAGFTLIGKWFLVICCVLFVLKLMHN